MRYKRVLLVFPAFESDTGSSRPSPSIAYLAQALEEHNIFYDILDMKLGYNFKVLLKKIETFCPDLIGFTVFTLHHKTVFRMIEKLKSLKPSIHVIVGGPHICLFKEKILQECIAIDFACCYEGEDLLVELCAGQELSNIKGMAYRKNGEIFFTGWRKYEIDLDRIGYPRLNKFELKKYANEILIISSRGCPYSCIYCVAYSISGKKIRVRSVKSVVDEIEHWYYKGRRLFNFVDDNFSFYEDRVYQICDEIERRRLNEITLRCSNGVRADKLNRKLLKRMKEVGFKSIGIGVESGNNRVLKLLKKGETLEEIEEAIKNACELGYEVALFFVFGTPGETEDDIKDSIKLALKYPVFKVDFYNLVPFPKTELFYWVNENNAWVKKYITLLNESDKNIRFGSVPFFITKEIPFEKRVSLNIRLREFMKQVEIRSIQKLFESYLGSILSFFIAKIVSTTFIQRLYFRNNLFRKIAEDIKYKFLYRDSGLDR